MTLSATSISVSFGDRTILDDVTATIPPGCITAILGPNGAGKTTLMRVLSGDLTPDTGSVTLAKDDVSAMSAATLAAKRAVLPQHTQTAFGFKAWELVRLGRAPFGDTSAQSLTRVQSALVRVDALHLAERDVNTLSGGERQRVFLAKALCQAIGDGSGPGYLLLDEPAAALDIKQADSLMRILRDTAESGVGIAIIAHDVRAMRRYADRCLLVNRRHVTTRDKAASLSDHDLAELYDMDVADISV
jgi:iron complex transport system ATP-binding protein